MRELVRHAANIDSQRRGPRESMLQDADVGCRAAYIDHDGNRASR